MTRDEIAAIAAENGVELPKGFVSQVLTAFNAEKKNAVVEAADKALNDFADWKSPDEYAELEQKLADIQESSKKQERVAKYKEHKLNVDDEDILALIDGKLKDEKDFDKAIEAYVKSHPYLIKQEQQPAPEKKQPVQKKEVIGNPKTGDEHQKEPATMAEAVAADLGIAL